METAKQVLNEMKVGSCGVKWDRVVWKVGKDAYLVGQDKYDDVSRKSNVALNLEEAAARLCKP